MQNDKDKEYKQCSPRQRLEENIVSCPSRLGLSPQAATEPRSSSFEATRNKFLIDTSRRLPSGFVPGAYDVICARGTKAWNHSGNQYYRALVRRAATAYTEADTKAERGEIVSKILQHMRLKGNGFVKEERGGKGVWIEVGDAHAREKTGQLLRNQLASKYRSSQSAKKKRRRDVVVKGADGLHDLLQSYKGINQSMTTLKEVGFDNSLSDDEVLASFTQAQCNILQSIQDEDGLVEKFRQAEVSACLILGRDTFDSDGDALMQYL